MTFTCMRIKENIFFNTNFALTLVLQETLGNDLSHKGTSLTPPIVENGC